MNTTNTTNTNNDPGIAFAEEMKKRCERALSNAPKAAKILGDNARFDFATLLEAEKYLCWQFVKRIEFPFERRGVKGGKWKFSLETFELSYYYQGICYVEINVAGERTCHLGNNFWVARDGGLATIERFEKEFGYWGRSYRGWPLR